MEFFVIGDENMVLGFSLVGIAGKVAQTAQQTSDALNEAVAENIKIILISDRLSGLIQDEVETLILKRDFPLVIEVPGRDGPRKDRKSIRDLLKSSIGFSV